MLSSEYAHQKTAVAFAARCDFPMPGKQIEVDDQMDRDRQERDHGIDVTLLGGRSLGKGKDAEEQRGKQNHCGNAGTKGTYFYHFKITLG